MDNGGEERQTPAPGHQTDRLDRSKANKPVRERHADNPPQPLLLRAAADL